MPRQRNDRMLNCKLFEGLLPEEINGMMRCLGARQIDFGTGETVIWAGERVTEVGVILFGTAHSVKTDAQGKSTIVTRLQAGDCTGALLSASKDRKSPVTVRAACGLRLLSIPAAKLLQPCSSACKRHQRLLRNYVDYIAGLALVLHDRNNCLIKASVREKVMTYLTQVSTGDKNTAFQIPFDRAQMAEYLNVERSALSRELSRMKRDGWIDYYKNTFQIQKNGASD